MGASGQELTGQNLGCHPLGGSVMEGWLRVKKKNGENEERRENKRTRSEEKDV